MVLRVLITLLAVTASAHAQASYTATRDYSFAAFLAGGETKTGLGTTDPNVTFGLDVTRHFHLFNPSLELRLGLSPGSAISQKTFQVGFKAERQIGRVRPYADFLIGEGLSTRNGFHDNSIVPSIGGGVEYDLNDRWSLKADFQHQSWKLGAATPTFSPNTLTVGIAYRFHFGK